MIQNPTNITKKAAMTIHMISAFILSIPQAYRTIWPKSNNFRMFLGLIAAYRQLYFDENVFVERV